MDSMWLHWMLALLVSLTWLHYSMAQGRDSPGKRGTALKVCILPLPWGGMTFAIDPRL